MKECDIFRGGSKHTLTPPTYFHGGPDPRNPPMIYAPDCVSFPCVVYFGLFSPLKDRYAFSICIQLLGAKPPDPMYILGIHGGIFPPKIPPKNLSSFFVFGPRIIHC